MTFAKGIYQIHLVKEETSEPSLDLVLILSRVVYRNDLEVRLLVSIV